MSRSAGIIVVLWSLMTCSLGFTMDRSAVILSTWDTAPSLDTYQRIPIDPTSNGKIQTTNTDKFPHVEDAKVPMKVNDGMQGNQTREKRSTTENIGAGIKVTSDAVSTVKNDDSYSSEGTTSTVTAPRNVVLLLIDDTKGHDEKRRENTWQGRGKTLPFTIEGSLQSCGDRIETIGVSTESTLVSESKEKDCDCERLLYTNVRELLSWAKYTRQMATVSGGNLSNPLLPDYVSGPSDISPTGFDGSNDGDRKLELRKSKRDSNDAWQAIDLGNRAKSVPIFFMPEAKREVAEQIYNRWIN
ncbi:PREDICTED: uncharacterized protein LOC106748807 [Dinoponera quadriceps]|uniref:Uncharacterized protein LOC106748807 n=1 Tax=Dinoponera quadriceps TaxID=609295 RepID=A0A6P3XZ12_DINQU|nr:PREDICTED: uncharacterized protein LOC106748807 [Dinoponera quadriceps]